MLKKNLQPDPSQYTNLTLEELRDKQGKLNGRADQLPTITDLPPKSELQKEIDAMPKDSTELILARAFNLVKRPEKAIPQVMEYEKAKLIFWKIGQMILAQKNEQWVIEDENKPALENIVKYFIADPSGKHDVSKGLYIFGDVGRGKTFLMRVCQVLCQSVPIEKRAFSIANCGDISENILWAKDSAEVMQKYSSGSYCFDDLGNEPGAIKTYGNEVQTMERILVQRYAKFVNGVCITHVTSNDTPEEMEAKYGTRLADRAKEMFNFVYIKGESKRK